MKKVKKPLLVIIITFIVAHIYNKAVFYLATIQAKLNFKNAHFYDWRFGKIYYTKEGSGTPLLLIHDLSAFSSEYEWHKVVSHLKKKHTVYTLDLLGCGRSEKPQLTYTSFLYVQLLTDFIKNIIQSPTHIVATGLSSSFVTMACSQNSEWFEKLLFINPPTTKSLTRYPNKLSKLNKILLETPIIGTFIYTLYLSKRNVRQIFESEYFYDKDLLDLATVDAYYEAAHLGGSASRFILASINNFYTNINITYALQKVNNSIYIVVGNHLEHQHEILESYEKENVAIESSILNNTKYLPQLENPKAILEIFDIYFN